MTTDTADITGVADLADAGTPGMLDALSALPDDVRAIVVERALAELRSRGAEAPETFDPAPGVSEGERAPLTDITRSDRTQVIVFSMLDGEPHPILRVDRPRVLSLKLPNGKPAFWSPGMPGRPPRRVVGIIKCRLHPESAERAEVDELGFTNRYCNDGDNTKQPRGDFRNVVDRDEHEKRKHPQFYAAWQRYRDDKRLDESLQSQREMASAMRAMADRIAAESGEPAPARALGRRKNETTAPSTDASPSDVVEF